MSNYLFYSIFMLSWKQVTANSYMCTFITLHNSLVFGLFGSFVCEFRGRGAWELRGLRMESAAISYLSGAHSSRRVAVAPGEALSTQGQREKALCVRWAWPWAPGRKRGRAMGPLMQPQMKEGTAQEKLYESGGHGCMRCTFTRSSSKAAYGFIHRAKPSQAVR